MADMDELFGSDGDSDNEQRGTLDLHYCIDEWRCVSFMCFIYVNAYVSIRWALI